MQNRQIGRNEIQHLLQIGNALTVTDDIQNRPALTDLLDQTRKTKGFETIGNAVDYDMLAVFDALDWF